MSTVQADPIASIKHVVVAGQSKSIATENTGVDTPFSIASIGKIFTAVLILQLVQDGRLNLEDPAAQWLSRDVVEGFNGLAGVSIKQMLQMSSGLPDYYDDRYLESVFIDQKKTQVPEVAIQYAYDLPVLFVPGKRFDYSNTNYLLLGVILENLAGESYSQRPQYKAYFPV